MMVNWHIAQESTLAPLYALYTVFLEDGASTHGSWFFSLLSLLEFVLCSCPLDFRRRTKLLKFVRWYGDVLTHNEPGLCRIQESYLLGCACLHTICTVSSSFSCTFSCCYCLLTLLTFSSHLFAIDEECLTVNAACCWYVSPDIAEVAAIKARCTFVDSSVFFHHTHVVLQLP